MNLSKELFIITCMKILLVCQYYYPERFSVTDIAENLVKLGNEVTVVTSKPTYGFNKVLDEYKKVNFEIINGVKIHRVNVCARKQNKFSIINNYISYWKNAKKFIKRFKEEFDVVFSISLSPVISISPALLYAKKHNVPSVLYCEDLWPESPVSAGVIKQGSLLYKIIYKISKSIYSRLDRIIVSSPSFKEYFENVLKIKDKGFAVVYQSAMESKKDIEPKVYNNKHNIIYAGNIGKMQNIDLIVDAMKYVKTKDIKLHILGNGLNLSKIKEKIDNEKLNNIVAYDGSFPIEVAESYFKNADVLIVSLKNEGYVGKTIPNKAIQYMKYSRPLLGIISGDGKKLLKEANGTVFAEENVKDIAKKIDELCLLSEKEKEQMGKNNLAFFKNNLEIEKLSEQIFEQLKVGK